MFVLTGIFRYFSEVRREMGSVTWPTRAQTVRLTLLVVTVSIVIGVISGTLDLLFTEGFRLLIGK